MNLLEMQRRMAEDVMRPLTLDFAMQSETASGQSMGEIAASYIKPNDRLNSFERLEIYNRQYWFRVIAAVAEDFPALQAVLGEPRFDRLVLAYLREHPSTSFTLRNVGGKLPQWLARNPSFAPRRHSLALDVARLEWAYVEAFDGASERPLSTADLGELSNDSRLALQPHLQLLELRYPVDELVLAVRKATPANESSSNAAGERKRQRRSLLPPLRRSAAYLAVHRFDHSVYYRRLDREAFLLLTAIRQDRSLGKAIEGSFAASERSLEEQAEKIQEYFAHAAEMGWFCAKQPI